MNKQVDRMLFVKQDISPTDLISSISVGVGASYAFALSDIASYTELTALYDQYRFRGVELTWTPQSNLISLGTNLGASVKVWTAVDFDTLATPTLASIRQYSTAKLQKSDKRFSVRCVPRVIAPAGAASTASSAILPEGQWLNCSNAGLAHNGILAFVELGAANTQTWYATAKYWIEFQRSR